MSIVNLCDWASERSQQRCSFKDNGYSTTGCFASEDGDSKMKLQFIAIVSAIAVSGMGLYFSIAYAANPLQIEVKLPVNIVNISTGGVQSVSQTSNPDVLSVLLQNNQLFSFEQNIPLLRISLQDIAVQSKKAIDKKNNFFEVTTLLSDKLLYLLAAWHKPIVTQSVTDTATQITMVKTISAGDCSVKGS